MKQVLSFARNIVGLILIILLGLALILLFKTANNKAETISSNKSIETFTPTPTEFIRPTPRDLPPPPPTPPSWDRPLSSQDLTPETQIEPKGTIQGYVSPSYSVESSQDIINIVLNDSGMQTVLEDSSFRPNWEGATPGDPIFVKSIGEREIDWDYYLVPFYKNGRVSGLASVNVKDGMGIMGGWSNWDMDRYPTISAIEATEAAKQAGYQVVGEPRLVHRTLREAGAWESPFWEVQTSEGEILYVIFDKLQIVGVYKATEVHIIY